MTTVTTTDIKAAPAGHVPLRWVAVVFLLLAAFVYLTALTASPDDRGIAYQTFAGFALAGVFAGIMVFCVWANRRYTGGPLLAWPGWGRFLLEAAIAVPIAIGWSYALSFAFNALARLPPALMHTLNGGKTWDVYGPVIIAPAIYCLVGCTIAPVAEEMLYRGVLYRSLRPWLRPLYAILIQALLFGVMHRYGLAYISIAFLSGLLLMALYLWRETLWSPVLVHWLLDAAGGVVLLVTMLSASGKIMLGVSMDDMQSRAIVTQVMLGSPAAQAKVEVGDVITAIDDLPIRQPADVAGIIRRHKAGTTHVTLLRHGQAHTVTVELRPLRPHILW